MSFSTFMLGFSSNTMGGASQGLTLKRHIDATLGQGKVREAVRLPPGEDLNEWLAVNTVDFYNAISVLYSTLDECCTAPSCPVMSAGPKVRPACCTLCGTTLPPPSAIFAELKTPGASATV